MCVLYVCIVCMEYDCVLVRVSAYVVMHVVSFESIVCACV